LWALPNERGFLPIKEGLIYCESNSLTVVWWSTFLWVELKGRKYYSLCANTIYPDFKGIDDVSS